MKISELEGAALDMWVEAAERGQKPVVSAVVWAAENDYGVAYSTDWAQGGPIIERENICITRWPGQPGYTGHVDAHDTNDGVTSPHWKLNSSCSEGPTMLIAAMRAYVASKFGEEVPELTT